jgi:phosphohistidine phosphatase SixA
LVEEHSDKQVLILTGHEPWISSFSDYLSRQELPYRKGAAAAFKLEEAGRMKEPGCSGLCSQSAAQIKYSI